jgi:YidC/Oxa1 family membrane protein insertase
MNPNENKPSFMDKSTLLAFALIILLWFAWSHYLDSQQPVAPVASTATTAQPGSAPAGADSKNTASPNAPVATSPGAVAANEGQPATAPETVSDFDDSRWSFQLSSHGMGLKNITIKGYKTRAGGPVVLGALAADYPFTTSLVETGAPVDFNVEKVGSDSFVGHATVAGLTIEKTVKVNSETYSVLTDVKITGAANGFRGIATTLSDVIQDVPPKGFMSPSYDRQDFFVRHDATKTRTIVSREKGAMVTEANVTTAALNDHYFALAIVDHSDLLPRFSANVPIGSPAAVAKLSYEPSTHNDAFAIRYLSYAGPKDFALLSKIDEGLTQVIDYGMFAVLAKPILWLLKFLFSVIGNWGWSIIALTIIVRFIVLPFNVYSFKSMKAMQRIQPEMNRVKEKYKDGNADQKLLMNQEIMKIMKDNKANPLGGCLPMLLQLPVFLALYQVLGQSIELYQAPFILWIHDLSSKDPFFVLPVLMGATMFVQQKISPTTMDPQQAKIMVWMPVLFSFFMLSLPSGLTLYIFVSTLFGITQQFIFLKDKKSVQTVKEAKA